METMDAFQQGLIDQLPIVRRYALYLSRNSHQADDITQETVLRALTYRDQFVPDTNLRAWMLTIMRNCYFNKLRQASKAKLVSLDLDEGEEPAISGGQEESVELNDVTRNLLKLPEHQRNALLMAVAGFAYEDAAKKMGCPCGTIRSRISRARDQLQSLAG